MYICIYILIYICTCVYASMLFAWYYYNHLCILLVEPSLWSYQDGFQLVTVRTHNDFIMFLTFTREIEPTGTMSYYFTQ